MYNIKDVIIDRNNQEVRDSIGRECFTGKTPYECLSHANRNEHIHILKKVHNKNLLPFEIETEGKSFTNNYACIILKKD